MVEKYYTQSQVAERIGVHPGTVKTWRKQGLIKTIKTLGGRYRYPESEINRILGKTTPKEETTLEIKIPHDKRVELEKKIRKKLKRKDITLEEGIILALESWMKKRGRRG